MGSLNNMCLSLTVLEFGKSKIRVLTDLMAGGKLPASWFEPGHLLLIASLGRKQKEKPALVSFLTWALIPS